jgi:tetratricopeptide (TPR) repeat protein
MISSMADLCIRWWREAKGPLNRSQHRTLGAAIMRRILVWTPVLVLAVIVFGALGFYLFTGWRARDLTAKALANAEAGNARFARLQISSAASLRPDDPAVKRASALVESQLGNPAAVQAWEEIGWEADLNPDEIDARAESMARHGSEEQFVRAVEALEKQGDSVRAAELRSIRSLRGGNMEQAIAQARAAAHADAEPRLRLQLLQFLARRYGLFLTAPSRPGAQDLAAAREMSAMIDGLVDTPVGDEALAFGLEAPYFPPEKKSAWAAAAWKNAQVANPALLPAAEFLAVSGTEPATDLYNKLNVLFIGAPLPQQVAFARWMLNQGMHEQVLITASATEAAQDEGMFGARAAALAALGRWDELYRLADTPSKAPDALRLMSKALAADKLGRRGEAEELGRNVLMASVKEGRVEQAITLADSQNMRALADRAIIAMCANAAVADGAFRLARDRFSRRGQFATLDEAYTAARQAAPSGTAVRDYGLYRDLLGGAGVEPSVTAEALASAPTAVEARFNHALALLQAGQGEEALAVFEDFDVIVDQLPPGLRAVAAAVLAAGGDANGAVTAARAIDPHLLKPGEFALIAKWHTGP